MPSYAVVGASRGIGLEFVRQLSSDSSNTVFAVVRNSEKATDLQELAGAHENVHVLGADIADRKALKSAAEQAKSLGDGTIDMLINCAAKIHGERATVCLDQFEAEDLEKDIQSYMQINAIGVAHTINAFLPLLRAGKTKKILTLSTSMADCGVTLALDLPISVGYSASKAALNMLMTKYAIKLGKEGFVVLTVHPGWVKTGIPEYPPEVVEMIYKDVDAKMRATFPNFEGAVPVEETVKAQLALIHRAGPEMNGQFASREGTKEFSGKP